MIIHRRYLLSQGLSQAHELPFAQASKGIYKIQTESRSLQK